MANESEHPAPDQPDFEPSTIDASPEFEPSPATDQPETSAAASAPEASNPRGQAKHPQDQPKPPHDKPKPPHDKPAPPPRTSTASLLSSSILMIVGAAIAGGAYALSRAYAPPKPPGETAPPPTDVVKTADFKKLSDQVDKMHADMATAQKQIADRPDYGPDLKTIRDRMTELDRTLSAIPAQFDSINQKIATMSKVEDSTSAGQVDSLSKRLDGLAQAVDAIRRNPSGAGNLTANIAEGGNSGPTLGRAIELFKERKWSETRDAFARLQESTPNDASVWYLSALANGFATGQWQAGSETERLVNVGLMKERAGQPSTDAIDNTVSFLTLPTGKDWLAGYRKRVNSR